MFQYAIGRALSIRLGLPLVLDISMYRKRLGRVPRSYELWRFRLSGQRVRDQPFLLGRVRNRLTRISDACGIGWIQFVKERGLQFHPEVLDVKGSCQLIGYWQSERYFESIAGQLREDFTFVTPLDARSAEYESRIRRVKSVALQFRRSDFVGNSTFDICGEDYYSAALELVMAQIGRDIELFVFSDDIDWCRNNVRYSFPTTYVNWERMDSTGEDLRLMSACRALVMANSSFGWWAGWLNSRPDKLAVGPRRWFGRSDWVSELPRSPWLIAI